MRDSQITTEREDWKIEETEDSESVKSVMVISQIWTQGFSSRWKTLDQSAGGSSCIDTDNYVIHSFVCLFFLSLFRSFVRLFPLSAVRLFFFVQCFACPLLPIVYSKMVSLYMS